VCYARYEKRRCKGLGERRERGRGDARERERV
jgi:hypothetical protein